MDYFADCLEVFLASMKAPPKRKGNKQPENIQFPMEMSLNESPSEKEGK